MMAQVPPVETQQVMPRSGGIPFEQISPSPEAFGGGLAAGLSQLGQTLDTSSNEFASRALAYQDINNKTESDAAYAQYLSRENAYLRDPQSGYMTTKQGKAALDGYPGAMQDLNDIRNDVANSIQSPRAKLMFDQDSRRQLAYSESNLSEYVAGQRKTWIGNTNKAVVETTSQGMLATPNDSSIWNTGIAKIQDSIAHTGASLGWDQDQVNAAWQDAKSNLWAQRILLTSQNNEAGGPLAAQKLYSDHMADLSPKDMYEVGKVVRNAVVPFVAKGGSDAIFNGTGYSDPGAVVDAIRTDGEHGKPGQVGVVYPKTGEAPLGAYQIMPSTAQGAANELGIQFDKNNLADQARLRDDPAFGAQIAKQVYTDNLRMFNGDPVLATAAYNSNPSNVKAWVAQLGDPAEVGYQKWISEVPVAETKAYLTRVFNKVGLPQGVNPTDTDPDKHFGDYMDMAQKQAEALFPGDAEGQAHFVSAAENHAHLNAQKQNADEFNAYNTLLTTANGGADHQGERPTNVQDLITNTQNGQALWSSIPQDRRDSVQNILARNANPTPQTMDQPEWDHYRTLRGMAITDPQGFAKQVIPKEFPQTWQTQLWIEQQHAAAMKPQNTDITHAMSLPTIQDALASAKLDSPAYNQFVGSLNEDIQTFIDVHGRKPNDTDVMKMGSGLMAKTYAKSGLFSGLDYQFRGGPVPVVDGVPNAAAKDIADRIRLRGTVPDENTIRQVYQASQGTQVASR